jgi:putative ABC transport system permease protein
MITSAQLCATWAQKLRTFLTVFGIVWGTVAISLLLAFGTGLHKQMIKNTAGSATGSASSGRA